MATTPVTQPQPQQQEPYIYFIKNTQRRNPVWSLANLSRKICDTQVADFILKEYKISILFLSLEFHYKYPMYINGMICEYLKSDDSRSYPNKVLLVLHDTPDVQDYLLDVTQLAIKYNMRLLLAFKYEDVANYLKAFRSHPDKRLYG